MARFGKRGDIPAAPVAEVKPGEVRVSAAEMAAKEQSLARAVMGLAMDEKRQLYANGSRLLDSGEARAKALRAEFEAMMPFDRALDAAIAGVEAEKRRDVEVPIKDLYLDRDGLLRCEGDNRMGIVLTDVALSSLGSFAPSGAPRDNLNAWSRDSDKIVKIRTRNPIRNVTGTNLRTAYAVVSPTYGAYDLDAVCKTLRGSMPKDARGVVYYDGQRWRVEAALAPTMDGGEIGVGRVFRVRTAVNGSDDRRSGIIGTQAAERIRCINCTTIVDENYVFRARHVGDIGSIFEQSIGASTQAMAEFSELWREANTRAIVDQAGGTITVEETFKRLIAHGYVDAIPGGATGARLTLEGLMSAYEKEPLGGAAGVNAAITRYAHEQSESWGSAWTMNAIEQDAGKLLFERVYSLPGLTDRHAAMFASEAAN